MLGRSQFDLDAANDTDSPIGYGREDLYVDISQLELGPDTFNRSDNRGNRLYLVEDLPLSIQDDSKVYALCSYDWSTDRKDDLEWVGYHTGIDPAFSREALNEVFEENDVAPVSEEQFNLISSAYADRVESLFRNGMLEKAFEFYEKTFYMEVPMADEDEESSYGFPTQLIDEIEQHHKTYERCKEKLSKGEMFTRTYQEAHEVVNEQEPLDVEHIENLDLIPEAIDYPHEGEIKHVQHATYVAEFTFEEVADPLLRTIEFVQQGIFNSRRDTALALALFEWGWSQTRIADELDKSESTISQQLSSANALLDRAKWTVQTLDLK